MFLMTSLLPTLLRKLSRSARLECDTRHESGTGRETLDSRTPDSGFTLMELLIVMSVILILMLVAIPSLLNMRSQANETSALQSLRAINQAQIQYQTNFPANGFACSLAALGGNPSSGPPSATAAQMLQGDLATGQKSGYSFNIVNCTKASVNNQDMITSYEVTAVPQSVGKTGHRGFCMDMSGEIKSDQAGGTNCTVALQ
jgi:type IV pilus assembly protein PilA